MLFEPAQTTATGVSLREMRSDEMSKPACSVHQYARGKWKGDMSERTRFCASVHTANAARREDLDARQMRDSHCPRDGRSAMYTLKRQRSAQLSRGGRM